MLNMKSDLALLNAEYSERLISEEQKASEADEEFAHELSKYEEHIACQHKDKHEAAYDNDGHTQNHSAGEASRSGDVKSGDVKSEQVKSTFTNEGGNTDFLAQINAAQQQSTSIQNHSDEESPASTSQLSQVAQAIEKAKQGQTQQSMPSIETDEVKNLNRELVAKEQTVVSGKDEKQIMEVFASKQGVIDPKVVNASDKANAGVEEVQVKDMTSKSDGRTYLDSLLANKEQTQKDSIDEQSKHQGGVTSDVLNRKDEHKIDVDNVSANKASANEQTAGKKGQLDGTELRITPSSSDAKPTALLQNIESTLTDELGYPQLSGTDKKALQSLLRDAIESGKLSSEGKKQAELTLQAMKNLDNEKLDKTMLTGEAELPSEMKVEQRQGETKPVAKKTDAAPSPLIAAKVGDESSRSHEIKALQEQNLKDQQIVDELIYKPDIATNKAPVSTQVEQLFKAVMQPTNSQIYSTQVQSNTGLSDFNTTIQMLDSVQSQQVNQNQQNMFSGKAMADPEVQQAINIARNDAAKVLQEKVSMMLNLNNKQAEIRLDPPELGSMQIRIRSDAEQAQVNFVVQNQQAKEALEQSMPKLKEMLAEQGIELGESNIQQENSGAEHEQSDNNQQQGHSKLANHNDEAQNSPQLVTSRSDEGSGIDYYA